MSKIRIAIVGVGNCASSLVQGISYYRDAPTNVAAVGLMHGQIGPYRPNDISIVAAFDIDRRTWGCGGDRCLECAHKVDHAGANYSTECYKPAFHASPLLYPALARSLLI